ncbi:MAG: hypothetical protein HRT74_10320, partial [Flavobacteriales bacterium]|nr:hypothetical protein [Flavobacteriales bacterium]
KLKVPYHSDILNSLDNESKYTTRYQKALNLGVYGADLAYLSNYEDNQSKLSYFKTVSGFIDDLNINGQIDQDVLDRFAANKDIPDSLHSINAQLFKAGDRYLKENQEEETATLILAGGWIESLHIAVVAAKDNPTFMIKVGEQKSAIESVVALVQKIEGPQNKELSDQLNELKEIFDTLEYTYEYVKPITDSNDKVTYINSKSSVEMDEESFKQIEAKVQEIRNNIIQ